MNAQHDLGALAAAGFSGEIVGRGHPGYDELRKVFNGWVDRRPALIARCTDARDVSAAVDFARDSGLPVSVYGGGHNVTGNAVCDDGVMDSTTSPTRANWAEYWPGLIRGEAGSRWREPGDRARLVLRLLGRPVELELTLRRLEPYRLVEYTSVQRGLPDARHERHFAEAGAGFQYRLAVELEQRPGIRRAFDRILVRQATTRAMRPTLHNLDRRFGSSSGAAPQP